MPERTSAAKNIEDSHLIKAACKEQAILSLQDLLADLRARSEELEPGELDALIEKAREQFSPLLKDPKPPADAGLGQREEA